MIRPRTQLVAMTRRQPGALGDRIIESGGGGRFDDGSFWALITGSSTDGTNRWSYTFEEAELTESGYGHWSSVSGGTTGTARNVLENMNSGSGTLGNGVTVANLTAGDADFDLAPCPANAIVRILRVMAGSTETYWFQYANGVDGGCS